MTEPRERAQEPRIRRILVATYQTLDVASDDADANFLTTNYPPDYFSHIVIDECHRSAWGKWFRREWYKAAARRGWSKKRQRSYRAWVKQR